MNRCTIFLVTFLAVIPPMVSVSQEPQNTGRRPYIVVKAYDFRSQKKIEEQIADFDAFEEARSYAGKLNDTVRLSDTWYFAVRERKVSGAIDPGPLDPGPTRPLLPTPNAKASLSQEARQKLEPAFKTMKDPWMEEVMKLTSDILNDGDKSSFDMLNSLCEEFKLKSEAIVEGRELLDRGNSIATIDTRKTQVSEIARAALRVEPKQPQNANEQRLSSSASSQPQSPQEARDAGGPYELWGYHAQGFGMTRYTVLDTRTEAQEVLKFYRDFFERQKRQGQRYPQDYKDPYLLDRNGNKVSQ